MAVTRAPLPPALTLIDWAKRIDPDGSVGDLVDHLNRTNPVMARGEMTAIYRIECIRLADDVDWCVKNGWRF